MPKPSANGAVMPQNTVAIDITTAVIANGELARVGAGW